MFEIADFIAHGKKIEDDGSRLYTKAPSWLVALVGRSRLTIPVLRFIFVFVIPALCLFLLDKEPFRSDWNTGRLIILVAYFAILRFAVTRL